MSIEFQGTAVGDGRTVEGDSLLSVAGGYCIGSGLSMTDRFQGEIYPVEPDTVRITDMEQETRPDRRYDRTDYLDRADTVINGERQNQYGEPEDNFGAIASMWTAYLGAQYVITPADVACMMALLKIARIATGTAVRDSYVDGIGYLALGGEISERYHD